MAFRQSPNIVASGAIGIVTGLAIAGGLVFALSLSAEADGAVRAQQETQTGATIESAWTMHVDPFTGSESPPEFRTYGNSTARMIALNTVINDADAPTLREGGEVVASNDVEPAMDQPQG